MISGCCVGSPLSSSTRLASRVVHARHLPLVSRPGPTHPPHSAASRQPHVPYDMPIQKVCTVGLPKCVCPQKSRHNPTRPPTSRRPADNRLTATAHVSTTADSQVFAVSRVFRGGVSHSFTRFAQGGSPKTRTIIHVCSTLIRKVLSHTVETESSSEGFT
jgi:hypothetical protein